MPTIDPRLLADIKRAESCRLVAYRDSRGYWTIGWGHLLDQTIDWTGHTISQQTADSLLELDIDDHIAQAQRLPEWAACDTPCRENALIECVFNLGVTHWTQEFPKTRNAIQREVWTEVKANLLNSPEWIREVGLGRVTRLSNYFLSGQYE